VCEDIGMIEFKDFIRALLARPGMYVVPVTYEGLCAIIDGFDIGRGADDGKRFHGWLVAKMPGYGNLHWPGIILAMAFPEVRSANYGLEDAVRQEIAIAKLGEIFEEYLQDSNAA
jgi:hypothetical protein